MPARVHVRLIGICVAVIVMLAFADTVRAEISPREYRKMQRDAPEELRIEVTHVALANVPERERQREREGKAVRVEVDARVLRIGRSRVRIHDGEKIHISYVTHRRERNLPGPGEPPVLEERKIYPAFLEKIEGDRRLFRPAAGMYSFERLEEPRREK